jgi:Tfp pilus assembly protein PilP
MRALVLCTALGVLTSATALRAQAKPTPAPQQPAPAPSTSAGQAKPAPAPAPAAKTPEKPAPAPAPQGAPPPAAPAPQTSTAPPPAPEAYTYRQDGRRDPFLSLVGGSRDSGGLARRTEGPAGINVGEITVRGILQSKGSLVAMVQGPDKKTYIVHQGDKFLDGAIKTITPQGLVVLQEVNDPLSLVKQREIRKLLKSLEDAKE